MCGALAHEEVKSYECTELIRDAQLFIIDYESHGFPLWNALTEEIKLGAPDCVLQLLSCTSLSKLIKEPRLTAS